MISKATRLVVKPAPLQTNGQLKVEVLRAGAKQRISAQLQTPPLFG